MPNLNRRALMAGAATLPAIAIPAAAQCAFPPDAELIAIGQKMKPFVRPYIEAQSKYEELSEQDAELVGCNDPAYMAMAEERPKQNMPRASKQRAKRPALEWSSSECAN